MTITASTEEINFTSALLYNKNQFSYIAKDNHVHRHNVAAKFEQ